ncbi:MAG TPA: GMC family oxidoreductase [Gaiellaceae bacterium]|nr:GMC family oxidoreductase [Gaiellaceae bacterium]
MSERYDFVVVGSGAGGGVVAGELAQRGRRVLLLETGPHLTAADFTRFEAKATHDLWWPLRFALIDGGAGGAVSLIAGRCVGGSTTINTKVALRAHANDYAKWHDASGIVGAGGAPFAASDLDPHYDRVERRLGVRDRTDWRKSVRTVEPAFAALGSPLEPVQSYTDGNCMSCGSCLQGCPTNAGKSTLNTYIHDAWAAGQLELRAGVHVERVVISNGEASGVEYTDGDGALHRVDAGAVVVAAGTLNSPQLLMRSGLPDSPSSRLVGRNLGFHPSRLVFGLFDEPQDTHMVYPITAHAMGHQHDEDGGFIVEATTMMDPIGFATTVEDENGPLWGADLVDTLKGFRHWVGLLVMVNDENNGSVHVDTNGVESFEAAFNEREQERIARAFAFSRDVLVEAGASKVRWTGLVTTHVQGTCRMGSDPERSVVDQDAQSWDVKRLYVGDGSVVPRTLSVNPSLTIMALASRLAEHLDGDPHGYLS